MGKKCRMRFIERDRELCLWEFGGKHWGEFNKILIILETSFFSSKIYGEEKFNQTDYYFLRLRKFGKREIREKFYWKVCDTQIIFDSKG